MEIVTGFFQNQNQSLQITPQIQQALKLLQIGTVELNALLEKELLENPALESENEDENSEDGEEENFDRLKDLLTPRHSLPNFSVSSQGDIREKPITQETNLVSHLMSQIRLMDLTNSQMAVIAFMVGNLNDDGYLELSNSYIQHAMDVCMADVEEALAILQSLEPVGIGARTLPECLLIQLESQGRAEQLEGRILKNHCELIQERKFQEISKRERVTLEQVRQAMRVIGKLNPFPGRSYNTEKTSYIVPDIYLTKVDGDYIASLNERFVPQLRISARYQGLLNNDSTLDRRSKSYMRERARAASWILRCLHQRNTTLLKVINVLARHQREFLDEGVEKLKPLVLKEVAKEVGLHESTISRAIANKYVETPRGLFELKCFFTHKVKASLGEISSIAIKERIKKIISLENSTDSLSDNAIAAMLSQGNVTIARRTVAKYREALGIASYTARRACGTSCSHVVGF